MLGPLKPIPQLTSFLNMCTSETQSLNEAPETYEAREGIIEQRLRSGEIGRAMLIAGVKKSQLSRGDFAFAANQAMHLGKVRKMLKAKHLEKDTPSVAALSIAKREALSRGRLLDLYEAEIHNVRVAVGEYHACIMNKKMLGRSGHSFENDVPNTSNRHIFLSKVFGYEGLSDTVDTIREEMWESAQERDFAHSIVDKTKILRHGDAK